MSQGNFFAIGADEFSKACELGLRPAVALLVLACGTQKDNSTTSWSAQAVFNHTGMAWRRAIDAIEELVKADLVSVIKTGKKPRYKLSKPTDMDSFIWLPREIIEGAGNETPPVRRLRERGNALLLQKFIELYSVHDLTADGGLPRTLVRIDYERVVIGPCGVFVMYGFKNKATTATSIGPLKSLNGIEDDDKNKGAWVVLNPLYQMGLLEIVTYMAESSDYESELLYQVNDETYEAMIQLSCYLDQGGGQGFSRSLEAHLPAAGLAVRDLKDATMIGVYRLRYRPKTAKTTVWYATQQAQTERFVVGVQKLCGLDVDIKGFQGSSKEINGYQ